jgi:hypothetical protein
MSRNTFVKLFRAHVCVAQAITAGDSWFAWFSLNLPGFKPLEIFSNLWNKINIETLRSVPTADNTPYLLTLHF